MTIIIVTFIVINFFYSNYFVLNRITNNGNEEFRKKQLNMYQYVLDNTNQEDIVHDGGNEFNLFRKDMHYFWFTFHTGGLFTYNEVTNNRLGDYNPCQEIQDKKPKIASGTGYDYQTCDAKEMYEFSGYNNLVKRK